jgi:hypothetical protein
MAGLLFWLLYCNENFFQAAIDYVLKMPTYVFEDPS